MNRSLGIFLAGFAIATILAIVVLKAPSDTVASWALIGGLSIIAVLTVYLSSEADRDRG